MFISLKYLKVLRHVSILIDHHQGVCPYLAKVTEYLKILKFKNNEFKITTINSGVLAAIHVAGVRGDPCGAVRCTERPGTHCTGGWVGLRAGLDRCGESRPHRDSIPRPSSP